MEALKIEAMAETHWPAVRAIFLQGIATGDATFETAAPDWEEWNVRHLVACRLMARAHDEILGWAALSPFSSRRVYQGVAEVSIYVAERVRGRHVGAKLLDALVGASEKNGIWTLQAGILAENTVSIHLHERAGFRVVGRREKLGCLKGRWRDVVLMERRSRTTGI